MPARSSLKAAREFAERHAAWIGARLRVCRSRSRSSRARHAVARRRSSHRRIGRASAAGYGSSERAGAADLRRRRAPHVARRVADFLKREARKDLEAAVARHCEELGVKPRRIVLRDTVSRWGSCSSTGALNFSWRLILAPPFVLDYLAAHEVAHIVHMNHSPLSGSLRAACTPEPTRRNLAQGAWREPASLRRDVGVISPLSRGLHHPFQRVEHELQVLRTRKTVIAVLDQRQRRRSPPKRCISASAWEKGTSSSRMPCSTAVGAPVRIIPPSRRCFRPSSIRARVKKSGCRIGGRPPPRAFFQDRSSPLFRRLGPDEPSVKSTAGAMRMRPAGRRLRPSCSGAGGEQRKVTPHRGAEQDLRSLALRPHERQRLLEPREMVPSLSRPSEQPWPE